MTRLLIAFIIFFPHPQLPVQPAWQSSESLPSLSALKLSDAENRSIIAKILSVDGSDACGNHPGCLGESNFRAEHIDLGEGAENGLAVLGNYEYPSVLCGGTGNCATWFLRKVVNQWNLIIGRPPDRTIERPESRCANARTCEPAPWPAAFVLLEGKHNGLKDIAFATNRGGLQMGYEVWEFNGTRYVVNSNRKSPVLLQ